MLSPLILFTLAGNILPSYVLPGLPALALLVAGYHTQQQLSERVFKLGLITPVLIVIVAVLLRFNLTGKEAEKSLMAQWASQAETSQSELYYLNHRPFSAQFYSNGRAKAVSEPIADIMKLTKSDMFIAIDKKFIPEGFLWDKRRCELRGGESKKRELIYCKSIN